MALELVCKSSLAHRILTSVQSTAITPIACFQRRVSPSVLVKKTQSLRLKKFSVSAVLQENIFQTIPENDYLHPSNAKGVVNKKMGEEDTSLLSTTEHRLWVAAASTALSIIAIKSITCINDIPTLLTVALSALAAYILADFGSGVYHFGIDNYGDSSTPVVGKQIDAFQGHHKRPWTITERQFANNLSPLAKPTLAFILPFILLPDNAALDSFISCFMTCVMYSQQFHAWSHTPTHRLPKIVVALQNSGLLVSRKMHGAHHRPPYDVNYCIVSGICNRTLDQSGFFKFLETSIWRLYGIVPRSWEETTSDWLEEAQLGDSSRSTVGSNVKS